MHWIFRVHIAIGDPHRALPGPAVDTRSPTRDPRSVAHMRAQATYIRNRLESSGLLLARFLIRIARTPRVIGRLRAGGKVSCTLITGDSHRESEAVLADVFALLCARTLTRLSIETLLHALPPSMSCAARAVQGSTCPSPIRLALESRAPSGASLAPHSRSGFAYGFEVTIWPASRRLLPCI